MNITLKLIDGNVWLDKQVIFKKITNRFILRDGMSLFIIRKTINVLHAFLRSRTSKYRIYNYHKESDDKSIGYFTIDKEKKKLSIDLASDSRIVSSEIDFERGLLSNNQTFNVESVAYHCQDKEIRLISDSNIDELYILVGAFILWHFNPQRAAA